MKNRLISCAINLVLAVIFLTTDCVGQTKSIYLESADKLNKITLSISGDGALSYTVVRRNEMVIDKSPLGLDCDDQNFKSGLSVADISPVQPRRERYTLVVANNKNVDHLLKSRSITFKNAQGALMIIDLVAGKEGVAFRYRFQDGSKHVRSITDELTGFHIPQNSKGWMEPYDKAGRYTPGYEDFYQHVNAGDPIIDPRNPAVGWCMPALFNVKDGRSWVLIAETGTDGTYPGCHLKPDARDGVYQIAFAEKDEKYTLQLADKDHAYAESRLPWAMPWRTIITGDNAGEILLSTLITDLAPASKINNPSWIEPGKAAWSWWSHPDDNSPKIYNEFTDLAASFGFKYTLFDAGWEKANKDGKIIDYALSKRLKPLVWGYSSEYFDPVKRKERFSELAKMGVKGVKIDFWCSDRQEVMAALQSVFADAAKDHLLIDLHGTTIPRGWQRTWPNYVTAEAVLGAESYFYEPRFPEKAAEQNTVLPFTRNVAGPVDYTPFGLTIRKYARLNTAAHELAMTMIYTSGIIHFADSKEVFDSLPADVKNLFKEMPATWDKTACLVADPGKSIVLYRQKGPLRYIVGINGTNNDLPIALDLRKWSKGFSKFRLISEGDDPLMGFNMKTVDISSAWSHKIPPKGGFVIQFIQ